MPAGDTFTVQTSAMARPVRELMQSRSIVATDVLELRLGRQLNQITNRLIERVIAVAMLDARPLATSSCSAGS